MTEVLLLECELKQVSVTQLFSRIMHTQSKTPIFCSLLVLFQKTEHYNTCTHAYSSPEDWVKNTLKIQLQGNSLRLDGYINDITCEWKNLTYHFQLYLPNEIISK
jgi:hypothetical protein